MATRSSFRRPWPWQAEGTLSSPYYASQRLLVELLGSDERALSQANSLVEGVTETTNLLGPALACLVVATLGPADVLFINVASYAISALLLVVVSAPPSPPVRAGPGT